jgi:BirA family transcriptional regulator, biotin operon repressor / biotin---[acetyl-CoA-carboxylase] ligase
LYKIPANTLFVGKNVVFVPECHSTNSLALEIAQSQSAIEGTVVITHHQTAGRGQRGNQWFTEAGKNLTLSIIIKPTLLPVKDQFLLNVITALAVRDVLIQHTRESTTIKWPNDILVHHRKICGILIENQLHGSGITTSIVGVGLNVNQETFPLPTATSLFAVTQQQYDLQQVFQSLLTSFEARYLQLRNRQHSQLTDDYLSNLHWKNELHLFSSNNQEFEGTITGIDQHGRLQVETQSGMKYFDVKEITYLH